MGRVCTVLLCMMLLAGLAVAQDAEKALIKGKVTDADGKPVPGVRLEVLDAQRSESGVVFEMNLLAEVQSGDDGGFSFARPGKTDLLLMIVAREEGFAIGFANWNAPRPADVTVKLVKPAELTGAVVDQAGKPLADVEVRAYLLYQQLGSYLAPEAAEDVLVTRTDAQGSFTLTQLPVDCGVRLRVRAPGRAKLLVPPPRQQENFAPGQPGIKIVLPVEARIQGRVIEKGKGTPVAGVKLQATSSVLPGSAVSDEDGMFTFDGLHADTYRVSPLTPRDETPDWVAQSVQVNVEAGKTATGVTVELSKGGILEVLVTDVGTGKPLEGASVHVRHKSGAVPGQIFSASGRTGKDGVARLRVIAGTFAKPSVYKTNFSAEPPNQELVEVAEGETRRIEVALRQLPKIRGVVLDETGKPLEGAEVRLWPFSPSSLRTGPDGRFDLASAPGRYGGGLPQAHVLARHTERNLAMLVEAPQEEEDLEIKMKPGLTLSGKVVDTEDKPIANARVSVYIRIGNYSSTFHDRVPVTDKQGCYRIKALAPDERYTLMATAEGYGRDQSRPDLLEAGGSLEVEDLVLPLANLTVSGVVVDGDDKPVAGAHVSVYGQNQPSRDVRTAADGTFTLEKVCDADMQVYVRNADGSLYGQVSAKGGDKDVKLVMGKRQASGEPVEKQPPSLTGKPLPELTALNVKVSELQLKDKMILVCFWDSNQRPSRHCVKRLAAMADALTEKGVVPVLVHVPGAKKSALRRWTRKLKIPFCVAVPPEGDEDPFFAWGVRGLPWLVLTDSKHVVRAEGFALNALDEKLKGIDTSRE